MDNEKREIYDRQGEEGIQQRQQGGPQGFDPFSSFFGGDIFFGQQQHREHEIPKGGDVLMDLFVTLEELYSGNFVEAC